MKARKMFRTIETHTLGHPTRNVVSGFRHIPGKTMAEKFTYMKENEDWFRKVLAYEPRGSEIMSCTLITEPCTPGTDVGVLYFEASCWLPMCGHDTMGVAVALIEAGLVDVKEPMTTIKLDTAAGVITVEARVENGTVEEVSFLNAPALVLNRNVEVDTRDFGKLTLDISWGGNVYAILPADRIGLTIEPHNSSKLVEAAQSIARDINSQVTIRHPELPFVNCVTHVEFSGPPKNPEADIQNCVVALPKVVDRSPCGTGTSAKAALLFEEGKLKAGDSFVHESIIGSLFKCEVVEETTVGRIRAVYPKITGNACIMGFATWILDPKDPFPEGFLLD
ncbi:proline racemase family protein [Aminipila luticellarii]|uniref:Proline racemase n=1 Tax=Aminipila luticellarii TaxID=2507160 RepID=A0A410PWF9_9FIRM|nr:proline racemase family protein [Aminipila luticellarii]QAT43269.1 proline racemase [Aminipila luticellarii]